MAAIDKKVGVFGDDTVDDAFTLKVRELGISFIRSNDIGNVLGFQGLIISMMELKLVNGHKGRR